MRLLVCLGLVFGIFAMHEMVTSTSEGDSGHHATVVTAAAHDMGSAAATAMVQVGHNVAPNHGENDLTGCCGLAMLCMAMLIGLGALLVLRSRGTNRVLWQLPPPARVGRSLRLAAFGSLTPLQRSSVLRC